MRLIQAAAISALCFMTRTTCATVPVFDDATPARQSSRRPPTASLRRQPTSSTRANAIIDLYSDSMLSLQTFLMQNVDRCIAETPEGHGVLLHIDDQHAKRAYDDQDAEAEEVSEIEKRFIKATAKFWKGLAADQRLAIVGSLAGAIGVPGYLISAANSANEENIHNIKMKAAKKIVFAEAVQAGEAAKAAKEAAKDKSVASSKKARRDAEYIEWGDVLSTEDVDELDRRTPIKLSSSSVKILNGGRLAANQAMKSHSPVAGTAAASTPTATAQSHAALGKILTWTGITSGLLYIPTALSSYHRAVMKTDDDLTKYRRRAVLERRYGMPSVTCVAIKRTGAEDFVIPEGALSQARQTRRDGVGEQITQQQGFPQDASLIRREPQSVVLAKLGSHAKMGGIGVLGLAMGYTMHQMGQRRAVPDEGATESASLVRRDTPDGSADMQAERRWTPGKGSVLFGGILAGGAVSRAGLWHPEKHASLVEAPARKRSLQPQRPFQSSMNAPTVHKRGGIGSQIHRGLTDKVTMSVGALALGFASVKTGLFGKATDALKRPSPQQQAKAAAMAGAAPAARRTIEYDVEEEEEELEPVEIDENGNAIDRRGMARALVVPVAAFAGVLLGQRTGKQGQKNENNRYLQSIGEKPPPSRRDVDEDEGVTVLRRSMPLAKRGGNGSFGRSLSRSLSRTFSSMRVPSMRVTKIVAEAHPSGRGSSRGFAHSRSPSPSPRYRSASPSGRGRTMSRGSRGRSSSSGTSQSPSMHPEINNFYKDNPQVNHPNSVKEVHVIHHNDPSGGADAASAVAAPAKKGGGKGKLLIGGVVGVGAGVAGHTMYTNAQAAKAQAESAAPPADAGAAPVPEPATTPAAPSAAPAPDSDKGGEKKPARRSLSDDDEDDGLLVKRKNTVVHEHVWHHAMPTGAHPSTSVHIGKPSGGGGGKKAIIGLVGGVIAGVVGHAMWNNAKVAQQQQMDQQAAAEAPPPARRRSVDEDGRMAKRSPAPRPVGRVPTALTGALAGVTAAAWISSHGHDEPGTTRKHTVPAGSLPTPPMKRSILFLSMPEGSEEAMGDASFLYDADNDALTRRQPFNLNGLKQMSAKSKGHVAIAGGLLLSTAVAILDPGQKEAQRRLGKRDNVDAELARRAFNAKSFKAIVGGAKKLVGGFSKKQKAGAAIAGGVGISMASASAQKANDKSAAQDLPKRSLLDEDVRLPAGERWVYAVAGDEEALQARASFGNLGRGLKTFVKSSSTNRDAVVVAGVSAGAAAIGLMKRGEMDYNVEDDMAVYLDETSQQQQQYATDGRRVVLVRRPADMSRRSAGGAEAKIGRMMDVGTIAMLVGSGLRFAHQRMTGAGSKAPEANTIKRSIVLLNDIDGEQKLEKRDPSMNAFMTTTSLAPMALQAASPVLNGAKSVAKGVGGKLKGIFGKKKGKREMESEEQQLLVKRDSALGEAAIKRSLEKREPVVGAVMAAASVAPAVIPKLKPAGKIVKTAGAGLFKKMKKLFHKRDYDDADNLRREKRAPHHLEARNMDKVANYGMNGMMAITTAIPLVSFAARKLKGKPKAKRSDVYDDAAVLRKRSQASSGPIGKRAMFGHVMTGTMIGGLAHPLAAYAVGGGHNARRSLREDAPPVLRRRDAERLAKRSAVATGNRLAKRTPGAALAAGMNGMMVGGILEPIAAVTARGAKSVAQSAFGRKPRARQTKRDNHMRASTLVRRSFDDSETWGGIREARMASRPSPRRRSNAMPWTAEDGYDAQMQARAAISYKLLSKASFATIGGSLAAPFIKSAFTSSKPAAKQTLMAKRDVRAPVRLQRRAPKEQEYSDLINKLKSEVEGKGT